MGCADWSVWGQEVFRSRTAEEFPLGAVVVCRCHPRQFRGKPGAATALEGAALAGLGRKAVDKIIRARSSDLSARFYSVLDEEKELARVDLAIKRSHALVARPIVQTEKRKTVRLTKAQEKRERVIFGAIQAELTGLKYCRELDARKLSTLDSWKKDGCSDSYQAVYKRGKDLQNKIQNEKHRYKLKYDKLTAKERERIIEEGLVSLVLNE